MLSVFSFWSVIGKIAGRDAGLRRNMPRRRRKWTSWTRRPSKKKRLPLRLATNPHSLLRAMNAPFHPALVLKLRKIGCAQRHLEAGRPSHRILGPPTVEASLSFRNLVLHFHPSKYNNICLAFGLLRNPSQTQVLSFQYMRFAPLR